MRERPDEQPVILSRCYPSKHTAGYAQLSDRQVVAVNGEPVLNLRQMYARIQELHSTVDTILIELACVGGDALITIDTEIAAEVTEQTLSRYRIPSAAALELLEEGAAEAATAAR